LIDLAADAAALVIPFVPAGATKVARHGDDVADGLNDARKAKNADNPSGGSNKPDNGADGSGNSTGNANSTPDEIGADQTVGRETGYTPDELDKVSPETRARYERLNSNDRGGQVLICTMD
jgi:hypothetical protein